MSVKEHRVHSKDLRIHVDRKLNHRHTILANIAETAEALNRLYIVLINAGAEEEMKMTIFIPQTTDYAEQVPKDHSPEWQIHNN